MPGLILPRAGVDGHFEWIPETPMFPSRQMFALFRDARIRLAMHGNSFRCVSCLQPVSFWDAFQTHKRGMRDKVRMESRPTLRVGTICYSHLAESDRPENQGKLYRGCPLHIMYWVSIPMSFEGPGCVPCQVLHSRMAVGEKNPYLDVLDDVMHSSAASQQQRRQR